MGSFFLSNEFLLKRRIRLHTLFLLRLVSVVLLPMHCLY